VLGRKYEGQDCAAAWALELVGERWSLLILRDAMFGGRTRFSEFQKTLAIASNILAKRLDEFVDSGLMKRRPDGEQAEYVLTRKGLELKPVIIALTEWGDKWVKLGPIVYESEGQQVELQLRRAGDDTKVQLADIVAKRRRHRQPSASRPRGAPAAAR
jgi:DNA-binding HxlR family transcriptional regulator